MFSRGLRGNLIRGDHKQRRGDVNTVKSFFIWCAMLAFAIGAYAQGGISWFMNNGYARYGGGTNLLKGAHFDNSVGCFVQLLWVGPNGTPDQAYNYGDGTGPTDDVVVDKRWIGAGAAMGDDGWFAGGQIMLGGNIVSGRVYFARFWSAPSPDWTNGLVPTSLTNRYANGPTWVYQQLLPVPDDFDVTYAGDVYTTLSPMAIPEPAAVGLVLVGLATVRMMRRRQS